MNGVRMVSLLALLSCLVPASLSANPVATRLINEIQVAPDSLERIEIHWTPDFYVPGPTNLKNWEVRTSSSWGFINSPIVLLDSGYVVIDSTDIKNYSSPRFTLRDTNDYLILRGFGFDEYDSVAWPHDFPPPPAGHSASLVNVEYDMIQVIRWYEDSVTTFGKANQPNSHFGFIRGTVSREGGEPLASVEVLTSGPGGDGQGITNSTGQYTIYYLPPGKYVVSVSEDGYVPQTYPESVNVVVSDTVYGVDFVLQPVGFESNSRDMRRGLTVLRAQSLPNPAPGHLWILLDLPRAMTLSLRIFDATGRLTRTLAEREQLAPQMRLFWDGLDDEGHQVPSGLYFYRLEGEGRSLINRALLVR